MAKKEFYKLFIDEIADLYDAENQIVEALPKMIDASSSKDLKEAFQHHLKETKHQVKRLETIFAQLNEKIPRLECEAMKGLLEEGEEIINTNFSDLVKDAALIGAAQRVEHYEMAGYGTARAFAKHLELKDIVKILQETLDEEGSANKKLTSLAEGGFFTAGINAQAVAK